MKYEKLLHIDLFSGIGGFALAADSVFGNVEHIFCDNDAFCQQVIKKHWPDSPILGDIRSFTNTRSEKSRGLSSSERKALASAREGGVFILTGGFPCQPFSQAGRRRGEEDDRFLWPEMLRVIREFSPLWVIAENVRGLLTQGGGVVFERVCTDLEAAGYEVQPIIIPAVAVGAPHRRDRVWFVAHRTSERSGTRRPERKGQFGETTSLRGGCTSDAPNSRQQHGSARRDERMVGGQTKRPSRESHSQRRGEDVADTQSTGRKLGRQGSRNGSRTEKEISGRNSWDKNWLEVATRLCRVDDGLPRKLDRNPRLKALGNAIVPQVAEEIMRAMQYENKATLKEKVATRYTYEVVDNIVRDVMDEPESRAKLEKFVRQTLSFLRDDKAFEKAVKEEFQHKVAKTMVGKLEGTVEKAVDVLRQNPTLRAEMVIAIEKIIKS